MLERVIGFSITHRALLVLVTIVVAGVGGAALQRLPIDAVPDITNKQVQINAEAASLSPVEMEQQITFPIETTLAGIPGLVSTRSISRNGFAQVTAIFRDDVNIYFARQQINERLVEARESLPPGVERAAYLRTVQDWIIRPQLKGLEGVAGIDVIGGYVKQYHVQPDPMQLIAYGLTFRDLLEALERNNVSIGAGYIEHQGEAYLVRADGRIANTEQIADMVIGTRQGIPIAIRDVATVGLGPELRTGSASANGAEVVIGTALMLTGANSRTVAAAVDAKMQQVMKTLPRHIRATTVLNRSRLVKIG